MKLIFFYYESLLFYTIPNWILQPPIIITCSHYVSLCQHVWSQVLKNNSKIIINFTLFLLDCVRVAIRKFLNRHWGPNVLAGLDCVLSS
jgi:hypothetical protein